MEKLASMPKEEGWRPRQLFAAADTAVTSFYKFVALSESALLSYKEALECFAGEHEIRGLVVIGCEGVNATVAGCADGVNDLKSFVLKLFNTDDIAFKDSKCSKNPFARFKVDLRPEIITTKDPTLSHEESGGTYLSPAQWHDILSSDPDVVLIDARNVYETEIGAFEGAVDPKIEKFSDFRTYMERGELPRDKKLLLYCTGGIRCEKAVSEVKRLGYENVYQLEGGILRYLEKYPHGYFKGECFVFDHRVAVDQDLQPSKTYRLCPHCGNPGKQVVECCNCGASAVICDRCAERDDRRSCSKNCAYHLRRQK